MNHLTQSIHQEFSSINLKYHRIEDMFLAQTTKKNEIIVRISAFLALLFQLFNIYRVLFLTTAKLGSLNNRIYFCFYLTMLLLSAMVLPLSSHLTRLKFSRYNMYLFSTMFYIGWNLLLASYSLSKDISGSLTAFTSSLLLTSILMQFKLLHTLLLQSMAYSIFIIVNFQNLNMDNIINITITVIIAISCSIILYAQEVLFIYNQQELLLANTELRVNKEQLRHTVEKHQFILEETNLFSFDWHLTNDTLITSPNFANKLKWPSYIEHPVEWIKERDDIHKEDQTPCHTLIKQCICGNKKGSMKIRLKSPTGQYLWYHLQLFIQYDQNSDATTVIGSLIHIEPPV